MNDIEAFLSKARTGSAATAADDDDDVTPVNHSDDVDANNLAGAKNLPGSNFKN